MPECGLQDAVRGSCSGLKAALRQIPTTCSEESKVRDIWLSMPVEEPMSVVVESPDTQTEQRDALVERLLQSASGAFDVFTVYLGDRLGFYQALAECGWLSSTQLALKTGTHERY